MRISDWSSDVCSSDLRPHRNLADMDIILCRIDFAVQQLFELTVELDPGRGARVGRDLALREDLKQHGRERVAHGAGVARVGRQVLERSEEHTSELQSLMRISYAVFCLKKKNRARHSSS